MSLCIEIYSSIIGLSLDRTTAIFLHNFHQACLKIISHVLARCSFTFIIASCQIFFGSIPLWTVLLNFHSKIYYFLCFSNKFEVSVAFIAPHTGCLLTKRRFILPLKIQLLKATGSAPSSIPTEIFYSWALMFVAYCSLSVCVVSLQKCNSSTLWSGIQITPFPNVGM